MIPEKKKVEIIVNGLREKVNSGLIFIFKIKCRV